MKIAVVKYTGGNTQSLLFALERSGVMATVTDDPDMIRSADKVIFPGVGAAKAAMDYLYAKQLHLVIPSLTQPVLGICLGMQLMGRFSEEGNVSCLGIFDETIARFPGGKKVPHMGWNTVQNVSGPLFCGVPGNSHLYFVHSYYIPVNNATSATTTYNETFSAAMQQNNFYAVQFHPEKSGSTGAHILQNFLAL